MSLWHARDAFNREQACRAAAYERGISPERQRELLDEAQELAEWCEVCCRHSAKFYAPIMHQVAGGQGQAARSPAADSRDRSLEEGRLRVTASSATSLSDGEVCDLEVHFSPRDTRTCPGHIGGSDDRKCDDPLLTIRWEIRA
jgi:hypothetical protein